MIAFAASSLTTMKRVVEQRLDVPLRPAAPCTNRRALRTLAQVLGQVEHRLRSLVAGRATDSSRSTR